MSHTKNVVVLAANAPESTQRARINRNMTRPADGGFKDHFSDRAAAYAAHRPTYPSALVDFLARVAPDRRVAWDSGCGSGQLSVLLAARFDHVIATDASTEQLAQAAPHPGVEYRCATAEASGLPSGFADLAVAAQAAHWFDLDRYYAEVRRVTRPRGVVAFVTYRLPVIDRSIDAVIRRFYSDVVGPYWPPERRHVEEGYRSLAFPFAELEAPELEIRERWALDHLLGYVETWSATRALVKAHGRRPVAAFREELASVWGPRATRHSVSWPLTLRVGRV
jgi:SAM-dependent methyltransferase